MCCIVLCCVAMRHDSSWRAALRCVSVWCAVCDCNVLQCIADYRNALLFIVCIVASRIPIQCSVPCYVYHRSGGVCCVWGGHSTHSQVGSTTRCLMRTLRRAPGGVASLRRRDLQQASQASQPTSRRPSGYGKRQPHAGAVIKPAADRQAHEETMESACSQKWKRLSLTHCCDHRHALRRRHPRSRGRTRCWPPQPRTRPRPRPGH